MDIYKVKLPNGDIRETIDRDLGKLTAGELMLLFEEVIINLEKQDVINSISTAIHFSTYLPVANVKRIFNHTTFGTLATYNKGTKEEYYTLKSLKGVGDMTFFSPDITK